MRGYPAPDIASSAEGLLSQRRQPPEATSRHRGFGGHLRAVLHAAAFLGLSLAGALLLAFTVLPVVVGPLLAGHFISHMHGELSWRQNGGDLLGLLIGLACYWAVLPAGLLAVRSFTARARRLSACWCGVAIGQAYAPRPPGTRAARRPGATRLTYRQGMRWLLSDPATRRPGGT